MAKIMTVLGPISPEQLGFTLPHEHIFNDLTAFPGVTAAGGFDAILDSVRYSEIMIEELNIFKLAGGQGIVDLTCRNMGGEIQALREIAINTGLNIVAGCGWYLDSYLDKGIYYQPTDKLAEDLINEIIYGVGNTKILPGIIGEIGTNFDHLTSNEERCLRAVAKAHQRTGLAISTHLIKRNTAFEVLDILSEYGVPPGKVIIGHCDSFMNKEYHVKIIKLGAYVQYDGIGFSTIPRDETDLISLIIELIQEGYSKQILLSHDTCLKTHLKHFGGHGFDYMQTTFLPKLREGGIDEESIHCITVKNPSRVLAY